MSHVQARHPQMPWKTKLASKTCQAASPDMQITTKFKQRLQLLMSLKQLPCMHTPSQLSVHLHDVKTLFSRAQSMLGSLLVGTITQKTPFPGFENPSALRKLLQQTELASKQPNNFFAPRKLPGIAENFQSSLKTSQKTPNLLGGL